ncbi:MAG: DUF4340 domain-containing protein [Treponema sp.]|nr:DUF4340 domain-containing protein [Treponema sp.]
MKTRKLILLIADGLLLIALIMQLLLASGDKVKVYELKEEPDEISITSPDESFTLVKENDHWFVGEKKYPANDDYVESLLDSLKSVKVMDKVASANNDLTISRYELNEGKNILVTAKKEGNTLRTLNIGKESTAGSQAYITVDGGKDIYLAGGSLSSTFGKDLSYFRSRNVYSLDKEQITSVSITPENGKAWTLSKTGSGENLSWYTNVPDLVIDAGKAADWVKGLASINTPVWHDDADLSGNKILTAEISCGNSSTSLEIYEIPAKTEEDKTVYYGFSSASPYQFELAAYAVERFKKNAEDLAE